MLKKHIKNIALDHLNGAEIGLYKFQQFHNLSNYEHQEALNFK